MAMAVHQNLIFDSQVPNRRVTPLAFQGTLQKLSTLIETVHFTVCASCEMFHTNLRQPEVD